MKGARIYLLSLSALLSVVVSARDLVWNGAVNEKWNLTDANWHLKDDTNRTPTVFASGDNAWFVDYPASAGALRKVVRILPDSNLGDQVWNVGIIAISNEVDSFVFSLMRNDADGNLQNVPVWSDVSGTIGGMIKAGSGSARFNCRFQHGISFDVHGGTIDAANGSEYSGEWYSVLGGLYADRRHEVAFHPGTTLKLSSLAIFGAICSAQGLALSFSGSTICFADTRNQNFGDTVFDDATFVFANHPNRISFSGDTAYRGSKAYVYPGAGSEVTFGFNDSSVEVEVDDVTGNAADDLVISNRLVDVRYDKRFANSTFCKTGKGTMVLANGYSTTTGDFQVAEGTLRLDAASFDLTNGASVVGLLDPPQRRTVSICGSSSILRIDCSLGPRHLPRNWELSLADGARAIIASEVGELQMGALSIADSQFDYSAIGSFGASGRMVLAGSQPLSFPDYHRGGLVIGLSHGDDSPSSTLEVVVAEITGDALADATIDLPIVDLPDVGLQHHAGTLRKTGQGTLRLTAANAYSGGTAIDGGVLEVDGSVVGSVNVSEGGYLGGTGSVGRVEVSDDGGFAVRLDADVAADALKLSSLSLAGRTRLLISANAPGRYELANRPLLRLENRPKSVDFSGWSIYTPAGASQSVGIDLEYDSATGTISASGELTIPSTEVPRGGMVDYYLVDWRRDTPSETADGKWISTNEIVATVQSGMLSVKSDDDARLDFIPNERCEAQPYAAFEADVVFRVGSAERSSFDSAAAIEVRNNSIGELAYFTGTGDGWNEMRNVTPVTNEEGCVEARVRIETDESDGAAKVSFVVDGVRLADGHGKTWFPRAGCGEIQGSVSVSGFGSLGNVTATRSDTQKLFATREADGTWIYQPMSSIPALVASLQPYYLVMPANCGPGSRYVTKLGTAQYSASGLGVWPSGGNSCTLFPSNGVWCVTVEKLPASDMDFVVPPLCITFVGQFNAIPSRMPLTVRGVKGSYGKVTGGELRLLSGMAFSPSSVIIGANTRLTIGGALGNGAIALDVALGGVFDASAVNGGQEVSGLSVDCRDGFGSIVGTRLAEKGELNLSNVAAVRAIGQVPCDLSATLAADRIMDWKFLVDGCEIPHNRHFSYADGRITWRNSRYPDDGLAGWVNLPMWGGGYMMNVVYTSNPDVLYSWADVCGPFRSNDGGKTWNRLGANLPLGMRTSVMDVFRTISVDPRDPDSIVALAGGDGRMLLGGFVVSRNGGQSWRKTGWTAVYGGEQRMLGMVLARNPNNPDMLIGGEDQYGLFRSCDNGETWLRTCFAKAWFSCVHWDRAVSGRVYACAPSNTTSVDESSNESGVWRSDDGGATWIKVSDLGMGEIVQMPGSNRLLGVEGRVHVRVSDDGGLTWTAFEDGLDIGTDDDPGHDSEFSYNAVSAGSNFYVVGTGSGAIYRRAAADASWTQLPKPKLSVSDPRHEVCEYDMISHGRCAMTALCSIAIDPTNEDHWFTTDWYSIWETTDAGASFTTRNVDISQLCSVTFEADPLDERYLAYGVHDMYLMASTNAGSSFFFPNLWAGSYGGSGHLFLPSIAYSPFETGLVFVAGSRVYGGYGIDRSTNHGVTWEHYECKGLPKRVLQTNGVNEVTFRPGRSNEVWACVGGIVKPGGAGPYVSTDRGDNWTWCGEGMDEDSPFYTIDSRVGGPAHNLVFSSDGSAVTHCKESNFIYRWSESDKRWFKTQLPSGMSVSWKFHSLVADPFTPGRYLLTCLNNIAESLDGGVSWHVFPGHYGCCSHCAFDVNTPGLLVILADDGMWVSWDGGKTFNCLPGGLDFASGVIANNGSNYSAAMVSQLTVDRRRVFVATNASGVFCRILEPPKGFVFLMANKSKE